MAKVFIEESTLTNIADAVRGKNGTTEPIRTVELATAITNLPTGGGSDFIVREFTPATSASSITLTGTVEELFGISELPHAAIAGWCRADGSTNSVGALHAIGATTYYTASSVLSVTSSPHYYGTSLTRGAITTVFKYSYTDNKLTLYTYSSSNAFFQAGVKYLYFVYLLGGN